MTHLLASMGPPRERDGVLLPHQTRVPTHIASMGPPRERDGVMSPRTRTSLSVCGTVFERFDLAISNLGIGEGSDRASVAAAIASNGDFQGLGGLRAPAGVGAAPHRSRWQIQYR